jgi:hypothetical protein
MSDATRDPRPMPPPEERERGWEQIAPGRYQPRRIRGSFRGRELG